MQPENRARNFLIMLKKSAADALKTSSKRVIQKTAEANGGLIGNKIVDAVAKSYNDRITKVSKIHNRIIQKLQMSKIKKYLKKDTYLQKKENKLLMN